MNEVTRKAKELATVGKDGKQVFPYADVPEDELTVLIADKYPTYFQQDDFREDYNRITGAKVPNPKDIKASLDAETEALARAGIGVSGANVPEVAPAMELSAPRTTFIGVPASNLRTAVAPELREWAMRNLSGIFGMTDTQLSQLKVDLGVNPSVSNEEFLEHLDKYVTSDKHLYIKGFFGLPGLLKQISEGNKPVGLPGVGEVSPETHAALAKGIKTWETLTPQDVEKATGGVFAADGVGKVIAGAGRFIYGLADFMTSPAGVFTLTTGAAAGAGRSGAQALIKDIAAEEKAGKITKGAAEVAKELARSGETMGGNVGKAVATAFAVDMALNAPQHLAQTWQAIEAGDTDKATELILGTVLGAAIFGKGVKGGTSLVSQAVKARKAKIVPTGKGISQEAIEMAEQQKVRILDMILGKRPDLTKPKTGTSVETQVADIDNQLKLVAELMTDDLPLGRKLEMESYIESMVQERNRLNFIGPKEPPPTPPGEPPPTAPEDFIGPRQPPPPVRPPPLPPQEPPPTTAEAKVGAPEPAIPSEPAVQAEGLRDRFGEPQKMGSASTEMVLLIAKNLRDRLRTTKAGKGLSYNQQARLNAIEFLMPREGTPKVAPALAEMLGLKIDESVTEFPFQYRNVEAETKPFQGPKLPSDLGAAEPTPPTTGPAAKPEGQPEIAQPAVKPRPEPTALTKDEFVSRKGEYAADIAKAKGLETVADIDLAKETPQSLLDVGPEGIRDLANSYGVFYDNRSPEAVLSDVLKRHALVERLTANGTNPQQIVSTVQDIGSEAVMAEMEMAGIPVEKTAGTGVAQASQYVLGVAENMARLRAEAYWSKLNPEKAPEIPTPAPAPAVEPPAPVAVTPVATQVVKPPAGSPEALEPTQAAAAESSKPKSRAKREAKAAAESARRAKDNKEDSSLQDAIRVLKETEALIAEADAVLKPVSKSTTPESVPEVPYKRQYPAAGSERRDKMVTERNRLRTKMEDVEKKIKTLDKALDKASDTDERNQLSSTWADLVEQKRLLQGEISLLSERLYEASLEDFIDAGKAHPANILAAKLTLYKRRNRPPPSDKVTADAWDYVRNEARREILLQSKEKALSDKDVEYTATQAASSVVNNPMVDTYQLPTISGIESSRLSRQRVVDSAAERISELQGLLELEREAFLKRIKKAGDNTLMLQGIIKEAEIISAPRVRQQEKLDSMAERVRAESEAEILRNKATETAKKKRLGKKPKAEPEAGPLPEPPIEPPSGPQALGIASGADIWRKLEITAGDVLRWAAEKRHGAMPEGPGFEFDNSTFIQNPPKLDVIKDMFGRPYGLGERLGWIPVLGKLVDPRSGVVTPIDEAYNAWAYLQYGYGPAQASALGEIVRGTDKIFVTNDVADIVNIRPTRTDQSMKISDVFESLQADPNSYILSPKQRQHLDFLNKLERDATRVERANKVYMDKVSDHEVAGEFYKLGVRKGPYFTRVVVERPAEKQAAISATSRKPGTPQPFQRTRIFESEKEGWDAKYKYETSIEKRLVTRVERLYRAVADRRLAHDPALRGRHRRQVRAEMNRWYAADLASGELTRRQLDAMIESTIKSGTVNVPAFQNIVFKPEVAEALRKAFPNEQKLLRRHLVTANNAIKAMRLGFDFGVLFNQGLVTMITHPIIWATATFNSLKALMDPMAFSRYVDKHRVGVRELAQMGSGIGDLPEFLAGLKKGPISRLRPARAFGRQFQTWMDVAKIEMWEAWKDRVKPNERFRLVQTIESILSSGRMESIGVPRSQGMLERFGFLAPSYYRGALNLVAAIGNPFSPKDFSAKLARNHIAGYLAGGAALYYAIAKMAGMDEEDIKRRFNPMSGDFMMWRLKGRDGSAFNVGLGGIYRSLIRLMGQTMYQSIHQPENWMSPSSLKNPFTRWYRGHAGPVVGLAWDFTGKDYFGDPTTWTTMAQSLAPLTLQELKRRPDQAGATLKELGLSAAGIMGWAEGLQQRESVIREQAARSGYGRRFDDLNLEERVTVMRAVKSRPEFVSRPPADLRTIERMAENGIRRRDEVWHGMRPAEQQFMAENGLQIDSYEPTLHVGGVEIRLSPEESGRMKDKIVREYGVAVVDMMGVMAENEDMPADAKVRVWKNLLGAAKARVRAELMNEINEKNEVRRR